MERREVLALVASVMAAGCTANRATQPEETPTNSSHEPRSAEKSTGSSAWGEIHIGNMTEQQVTYEITVMDLESSSDSAVRLRDTATLGPVQRADDTPAETDDTKTYTNVSVREQSHTHRVSVSVHGGPSGSMECVPSCGNILIAVLDNEIDFDRVTGGAPPAPETTTNS